MKKSTVLFLVGIFLVLLAFAADWAVKTWDLIEFPDVSEYGAVQIIAIGLTFVDIVTGIALMVYSRKLAKQGK